MKKIMVIIGIFSFSVSYCQDNGFFDAQAKIKDYIQKKKRAVFTKEVADMFTFNTAGFVSDFVGWPESKNPECCDSFWEKRNTLQELKDDSNKIASLSQLKKENFSESMQLRRSLGLAYNEEE